MGKWIGLGCIGALVLAVIVGGLFVAGTYNGLVGLNESVLAGWGEVENAYQRRLDLIPNLVETVKGAAAFEKDTFTAVTQARAQATQVTGPALEKVTQDPAAFQKFQAAQDGLSSALSRLMVVVEKYPDLKATEAFRDLSVQLEGTENRIAVARMRYNDLARAFNTKRNSFPTVFLVGFFGEKFGEKQYFKATEGASEAPKVKF